MPSKSIWRFIRSNSRNNRQGSGRNRSKRAGSSIWTGVSDAVLFKPYKSEWIPIWRDTYKLKRQLKDIKHRTCQSESEDTWLDRQKRALFDVCRDLADEIKALLIALLFHILTLILIVVFNVVWFAFLFWVIGVWLG